MLTTGRLFEVADTPTDRRDRTHRNKQQQSTLFDAPTAPAAQVCPVCGSGDHLECPHGTPLTLDHYSLNTPTRNQRNPQ